MKHKSGQLRVYIRNQPVGLLNLEMSFCSFVFAVTADLIELLNKNYRHSRHRARPALPPP